MLPDAPRWLRFAARSALVYGFFSALAVYWGWGLGFGSALDTALVGAVVPSALGGLYLGARLPTAALAWRRRRLPLRALMKTQDADAVGMRIAAGFWLLVFLIWAVVVGKPIMHVLAAHGVFAGAFLGSMGIGALWSLWTSSIRMSVFLGGLTWTPIWTAFIWLPAAFPPSMPLLNAAVNMNPLIGVMVAQNQRGIFWNPLFYGSLPYADYAVQMRGALFHLGLWTAVGIVGAGAACLILRRKANA